MYILWLVVEPHTSLEWNRFIKMLLLQDLEKRWTRDLIFTMIACLVLIDINVY